MTKATPEAINALIDAKNVSDKALLDTSSAKLRLDVAALDWSVTPPVTPPIIPPVIPPPVVNPSKNPGGQISKAVSYSNLNGNTIGGLTFDGQGQAIDLLVLNNCNGVHLTMLKFINTLGFAIRLNNCQNITADFNFWNFVNFGIHAENCISTKVNNNQGLNLNGPDPVYQKNFAHWIQFHSCSGAGQQVNGNILENVDGQAIRPHDAISIDASSGIAGSPIQINSNKIRGGQKVGFPGTGDTGGGIMAPDESGNYYEVKNNIMVNPGCSGIQANGTGSNILLDGNMIYNNKANPNSSNAINILGTHSAMIVSNNRTWWLNKNNKAIAQADGETGYYMGNTSGKAPGVTMANNNWLDTSLNENILPKQLITYV